MTSDAGNLSNLVAIHVWQIGLLGLIVGCVNLMVARRWPHLAYALWLVVLVKCFVPPLWSGPTGILGRLTPAAWFDTARAAAPIATSNTDRPADPRRLSETAAAGPGSAGFVASTASDDTAALDTPAAAGSFAGRFALRVRRWGPLVWITGSVLLWGIAIGRGVEIDRRLRRSSQPVRDRALAIVERIVERLRLRRRVEVLTTSTDAGPMVVGLWRMRVYVPRTLLERMQPDQLEAMLVHELAHIRRRDTWVAALQFTAQILW